MHKRMEGRSMASAVRTFQQCMEHRQLAEQRWPPALLLDKKTSRPIQIDCTCSGRKAKSLCCRHNSQIHVYLQQQEDAGWQARPWVAQQAQGHNCPHGVADDLCNPKGDGHGHSQLLKVQVKGSMPRHMSFTPGPVRTHQMRRRRRSIMPFTVTIVPCDSVPTPETNDQTGK